MENTRWPHLTSESRSRSMVTNLIQPISFMQTAVCKISKPTMSSRKKKSKMISLT